MHPIAPITQQLPKATADVVNDYAEVKHCIFVYYCILDLDYLRNSIKDEFSKIY